MQTQQNYVFSISDEFYKKIYMSWSKMEDKRNALHPDEAKNNPHVVLAEVLTTILNANFPSKQLSSAYFSEMYPRALKGQNPFSKEAQIRKGGVDPAYFSALLNKVAND
jgi:hypothetical protein